MGPTKGDTRSLDYSSYRGYIGIIKGLGFGVQGLGFRVQKGFRILYSLHTHT